MLVKDLSFEALPQLKLTDKVYQALSLMEEHHVQDLVVVTEGKFVGIIDESALLEVDDDITIGEIHRPLPHHAVKVEDHFLQAFSLATSYQLSVIPVVDNELNLVGSIEATSLSKYVATFLQLDAPGAIIVLEVDSNQYSFSEITRIVESNDAHITQLNTKPVAERPFTEITLRINKLEVSDIVASFQRYDYSVKYYFGEELYTNELRENYQNLMSYLNI